MVQPHLGIGVNSKENLSDVDVQVRDASALSNPSKNQFLSALQVLIHSVNAIQQSHDM